ncbi:MAG: cell division protein FtsZ [Oscillospiraceae bacterium]|nr:cell division protein FtsZ [Oscillospiraceae bacterium]
MAIYDAAVDNFADEDEFVYTPSEVIKVIGVGGGGGNAVNRMIETGIQDVSYIFINTDAKALKAAASNRPDRTVPVSKIQIGVKLTGGRGAGARPEIGARSADENHDEIVNAIKDANMVFIAAGMGGGTGTGAAPVVAQIAKEMGILTIAIVTKPFDFERQTKMKQAEQGIAELKKHVDSLIVIPNQRLIQNNSSDLTMPEAFALADTVLVTGVKSIAELITVIGDVNLDFADVNTIMKDAGYAHMATGTGKGKNRAEEAAKQVITSPLLETSISGATRLLVNIIHSPDVRISEIDTATQMISEAADKQVEVIWGSSTDDTLDDQINITVIASAFTSDVDLALSAGEADVQKVEAIGAHSAGSPSTPQTTSSTSYDNSDYYNELFEMMNK